MEEELPFTEDMEKAEKVVIGRQWVPGQSGNPGGRPLSLGRRVREATKDGADLVEFYAKLFHGMPPEAWPDETISSADRLAAGNWLSDRGFGKAPLLLTLDTPEGIPGMAPLRLYSEDELRLLLVAMEANETNDLAALSASTDVVCLRCNATVSKADKCSSCGSALEW